MEKALLTEWVVKLGRVFRQRGMKGHVRTLRLYFLALRHGLVQGERNALKVDWSEDAVLEWLRILRVPPFQQAYPVRPRGSRCGRCPAGDGHPVETTTLMTFTGGAKMGCRRCGEAWIELDGDDR